MHARVRGPAFVSESTVHNITFIVAYQHLIYMYEVEKHREGVFLTLAAPGPGERRDLAKLTPASHQDRTGSARGTSDRCFIINHLTLYMPSHHTG